MRKFVDNGNHPKDRTLKREYPHRENVLICRDVSIRYIVHQRSLA